MKTVGTSEAKLQSIIDFLESTDCIMLFVMGSSGTGKTHAIYYAIEELKQRYGPDSISVIHVSSGDSIKQIVVNKVTGYAKIIIECLRYSQYKGWLLNEFDGDVVEFIGRPIETL